MKTIACYITDHGHGHAARSCDLLAALHRRAPSLRRIVVTTAPEPFFKARLAGAGPVERRAASFDAGLVQRDAVRGDPAATLGPALELVRTRSARVREEAGFLRRNRVSAVICDLPSLPMEAASAARVPCFGVGNFSWDWIYREYAREDPRWMPAVRLYEEGYALADELFRLPFHGPMGAFRRTRDVALFARPGRSRRAELAERFGVAPGAVWVLVAFSSLAWSPEALARVAALRDHAFWTVRPLAWPVPGFTAVDGAQVRFPDLVASCDAVLSKPGFGIFSDCAVNGKPLAFVRREGFAESVVLEESARRHLRHAVIEPGAFYEGRVGAALRGARAAPPPPEPLGGGGDDQAAGRILEAIGAPVLSL